MQMEVVKTRELDLVERVATVWTTATAKRDDIKATDVAIAEAVPLMRSVLDASGRSFLLVGMWSEDEKQQVVSFGAVEPERGNHPTRAELRYLGVAPDSWGEGWARRLLVELPDASRAEDFTEVVLWVYANNMRAIWVYEAMGWHETGATRPHVRTGRIEAQYRLRLS